MQSSAMACQVQQQGVASQHTQAALMDASTQV